MSANPLFLALMLGLVVAGIATWRVVKRSRRPRQRQGPVPGYAITHGDEVDFAPEGLEEREWHLDWVEEYHIANRSRAVITVRAANDAGFESFARSLALEFQAVHNADVVFVDLRQTDGVARTRFLFAPDGRGWSGEPVSQVEFTSKA